MGFRGVGLVVLLILLSIVSSTSRPHLPSPPPQPETGPGGKQAPHAGVSKNRYGQGGKEYWIYEPDQPKPNSAPVVVFLHGWGGTNPLYYGAWIDHIVKRGNIVIFPRYQSSILTRREDFIPNTLDAIKDGIQRLQTERGHVRPDLNKFATVGHSLGSLLSASVAALAVERGLPRVRAPGSPPAAVTCSVCRPPPARWPG